MRITSLRATPEVLKTRNKCPAVACLEATEQLFIILAAKKIAYYPLLFLSLLILCDVLLARGSVPPDAQELMG